MLKGKTRLAVFCLLSLLLVAVPLLAAACGDDDDVTPTPTVSPTPTPTPTPVPTGTLTIAMLMLGNIEFQAWSEGLWTNRVYVNPMADYLTYVEHDTHELVPGLATRWKVSEDKKSVRFFLRQGVQFHDGWGELTSEDVKYTLEMALSNIPGATGSTIGKSIAPLIDRVETAGPYEVVVHFKDAPNAEFAPHWFSSAKGAELPITSKKHVEEVGWKEALVNPIFSGPYKYVEHADGEYLKLEALESHWRVVPEYKYLVFKEVPEEMTRLAMFKRGDVDIAVVTAETAGQLAESKSTSIVTVPGAQHLSLALWGQWLPTVETYDPELPWLDRKVRQAMNLAINREEIAEYIFSGYASPAGISQPLPWADEFEPYPYDPDRARELLEEAGYAGGFEVEFWVYSYAGLAPEMPEVIQAVAGYWDAIGLDTKITPMHIIAVYGNLIQRKLSGIAGVTSASTPFEPWGQEIARNYYSKESRWPVYESYELDELVENYLAAPSAEEKVRVARQMTQLMYDEYVDVPLMARNTVYAKNDDKVGEWITIKGNHRVLNYEYIRHPTPLGTFRLFEP